MFLRSIFVCLFSLLSFELYSQQSTLIPKRELRGVWVATVVNIDWPSKPGLPVETQKSELIRLLDDHQATGINAIMFQIRPTTDAFYGKGNELWSRFLTGKQGQAPNPYYDPLEFAIVEAHKRGMELHAWFNPYRASWDLISTNTSPEHITRKKPEWFFNYDGKKLFNPGIPQVRDYIVQVILNVVRNYDIDGVHFDDYFYPYAAKGSTIADSETFRTYGKGFSNLNDWRRSNVDTLIHELTDSIHAVKKYLKFGISPFGIWKNIAQDTAGSETNGGSSYLGQFADSRKWVKEGWVDYINPQIYWPFGYHLAAFEKLLTWWSNNTYGKHLYIGQAAYRAAETSIGWRDRSQIPDQVRYLRNNSRVQGSVFFSSKSLTNNLSGVRDSLKYDLYRYPALPPQMIWLDDVPPQAPFRLTAKVLPNKTIQLNWEEPIVSRDGETAYGYVIYRVEAGKEVNLQDARNILKIIFDKKDTSFIDTKVAFNARYTYVVTAIDRLKNESQPSNEVMP